MLFVAFGALTFVPLLTGLNPSVALISAGIGTLLFQLVTKGQVPIFLGSSFAFIAPLIYGIQNWGVSAALGGIICAGILYIILSQLIAWRGEAFVMKLFPPIVTGPIIMLIGMILAPIALNMAIGRSTMGDIVVMEQSKALFLSGFTLTTTLIILICAKTIFRTLLVLLGMVIGYTAGIVLEVVNFEPLIQAPWFLVPQFVAPTFHIEAILYIAPVAIAPIIEHFGDMAAIGSVTGENYLKKPGIHKTLLGDGLGTIFAGCIGGPPNTPYSEVTGTVALTNKSDSLIMSWAAIFAILFAFSGKCHGFLLTIPKPVMGGLLMLIFGTITVVGIHQMIKAKLDFKSPKNFTIIGIVLVIGLSGLSIQIDNALTLKSIALSALAAVVLNLIIPDRFSKKAER